MTKFKDLKDDELFIIPEQRDIGLTKDEIDKLYNGYFYTKYDVYAKGSNPNNPEQNAKHFIRLSCAFNYCTVSEDTDIVKV